MPDIMKALHEDHVNFSKLLSLLRRKLAMMRAGERPDFSIMLDAVDYLANYGNLYHHPKEDLIYQYHLNRSSEGRETIAELMQQHNNLKTVTDQLRLIIDGVLHEAVMSKDKFMNQLVEFIEQQTRHLNAEESSIFPMLERTLTAQDWENIEGMLPSLIDPLFGGKAASPYEALFQRIAEVSEAT